MAIREGKIRASRMEPGARVMLAGNVSDPPSWVASPTKIQNATAATLTDKVPQGNGRYALTFAVDGVTAPVKVYAQAVQTFWEAPAAAAGHQEAKPAVPARTVALSPSKKGDGSPSAGHIIARLLGQGDRVLLARADNGGPWVPASETERAFMESARITDPPMVLAGRRMRLTCKVPGVNTPVIIVVSSDTMFLEGEALSISGGGNTSWG